jgi:cysteine desulfurase
MKEVCVSVGSACSSGKPEPSRILKAIGLTDEEAFSTVRISIGENTTIEECYEFVRILGECLKELKIMDGE